MITRHFKKYKGTKKKDYLRSGKFYFENVLNNRTLAALPNYVWQVDGTFFNCSLKGEPKSKHFVLFAIDTANNELVLAKFTLKMVLSLVQLIK